MRLNWTGFLRREMAGGEQKYAARILARLGGDCPSATETRIKARHKTDGAFSFAARMEALRDLRLEYELQAAPTLDELDAQDWRRIGEGCRMRRRHGVS